MKRNKRFTASPLEASPSAVPANTPTLGRKLMVRGSECVVTKVLPLGTIECESLCGRFAFRVSGLDFSY